MQFISAEHFHTHKPCLLLFIFKLAKKWRKPLRVLWMPHCMRVDRQLILGMDMRTSIQNDSCMRVVWFGCRNPEPLKGWVKLTMLTSNQEVGHRETCRGKCVPLNMVWQCNYNEQLWQLAQHIYRATHEGHAEYSDEPPSDQEGTT